MPTKTPRERFEEKFPFHVKDTEQVWSFIETLLEEARQETKEEILKKIPELKVREIKLPQDDLRVLRARQYHNQKLSELSDFIQSL